ncbi:MAG: hypothetical protein DMD81_22175 [Candidatus Rokuibacteriota bacterium]|nr:MAG: hypothetical protein DMD81_22175 [Candidatus Rokubacteria bacterium]
MESELLRLAREVVAVVRAESAGSALRAALTTIARAYEPGDALARALATAWLEPARDSESALAVAWAEEQLRLALEDVLAADVARGHVRDDLSLGTLSWLLRAACETMAREAPGLIAERIEALLAFVVRH